MGEPAAFLQLDGIVKGFPGVKALKGVSFAVQRGAVHGLLGENGAGKSTLIKILGGDTAPDEGRILMDGAAYRPASVAAAMAAGVAVVHQELQLVPELSVGENLTLGRFPNRGGIVSFAALHARASTALAEVGGGIDSRAKVAHLSIGQRQMVEIAKAIMFDAAVIALDEPTSSLSATESEVLFRLVETLRARGKIILYVSHRLDEVFRLCDGATVLRDGKVAAHHATMAGVTRDAIVRQMVGREIQDIWGWRPRSAGKTVLAVSALSGPKLRHPASFAIAAGEILGFFGLVGAGRSELFRLVYGADARSRRYRGRSAGMPIDATTPKGADRRSGLVMCPEDRKADGIVQGRSVEREHRASRPGGTFRSSGLSTAAARPNWPTAFIDEAARADARAGPKTSSNSRAATSRRPSWPAGSPSPPSRCCWWTNRPAASTWGPRPRSTRSSTTLPRRASPIGVVSSELPEVMGICDRILVMREGRIAAEFKRETLRRTRHPGGRPAGQRRPRNPVL